MLTCGVVNIFRQITINIGIRHDKLVLFVVNHRIYRKLCYDLDFRGTGFNKTHTNLNSPILIIEKGIFG